MEITVEIVDKSNVDVAELAGLASSLSTVETLSDILSWARNLPDGDVSREIVSDIVIQDEYTHDIVVPWKSRYALVLDAT